MAARPDLLNDVCVGLSDLSLHAQRVAEVELVQVGVLQEVLGQRRRVAQALREEPGGRRGYGGALTCLRWKAAGRTFTWSAEFMKQVLPRLVRPQTPGCPLYESCSSTEFLLVQRETND